MLKRFAHFLFKYFSVALCQLSALAKLRLQSIIASKTSVKHCVIFYAVNNGMETYFNQFNCHRNPILDAFFYTDCIQIFFRY